MADEDIAPAFLRLAPNPMFEELARQAADALEREIGAPIELPGEEWVRVESAARQYGVPFEYVLGELEARVRQRREVKSRPE